MSFREDFRELYRRHGLGLDGRFAPDSGRPVGTHGNVEDFLTNPYGPQQRRKQRRMTTRGGNVSTHRILQERQLPAAKNTHR